MDIDTSENVADWSYKRFARVATVELVEAFVMGGSSQLETRLNYIFSMYNEWKEAYNLKLKAEQKKR